ncbi:glyoxysomal fatty acid beta-oxidation MFP-A protein, partial [Trifolium medium]|nr:glyoxysomal fatty acid beta-oxidation MFP-A protein [Trifolium medium]
ESMDNGGNGRTVLEVGADGVAIITIVNPPVNSLSFDGTITLLTFFIDLILEL